MTNCIGRWAICLCGHWRYMHTLHLREGVECTGRCEELYCDCIVFEDQEPEEAIEEEAT